MIHEKQVRQLCAIHSVNNLLQIPSDLVAEVGEEQSEEVSSSDVQNCDHHAADEPTNENCPTGVTVHEWKCNGKILHRYKQNMHKNDNGDSTTSDESGNCNKQQPKVHRKRPWPLATQEEFDNIAKEFTLREAMLMQGDESTFLSTTSTTEEMKINGNISQEDLNQLSMCQRIRSQYGTPYFGNYSLEVLEEALKRRGVELEFYRVPISIKEESSSSSTIPCDGKDSAKNSSKCLIGFIIYEKEENVRNAVPLWRRMGNRIPLVKTFFGSGEHWYTITGVKYKHYQQLDDASSENKTSNKGNDPEDNISSWCLIDSKSDGICTFDIENELLDCLREVQQDGGLVFRAYIIQDVSGSNGTSSAW